MAAKVRSRQGSNWIGQPVNAVMTSPVVSIVADAPLDDALHAMVRHQVRHLAVLNDATLNETQCIGVVNDRMVAAAWAIDPTALTRMSVRQVLDRRPAVVGEDATVRDAARLMHIDGVDAVAVIDRSGAPIGIVTGGDLVAYMAEQMPTPVRQTG